MQERQVWSLGREDPLEEEMATYSRILIWRTPKTKEPGGLQSMGLQKSQDMTEQLNNNNNFRKGTNKLRSDASFFFFLTFLFCIGV